MNNRITVQTISGGFILTIGLAMFTLLGNGYKMPVPFALIYIVTVILQFLAMRKIRGEKRNSNNKKWVNVAFLFLGITCWFSFFIGLSIFNSLSLTWLLLLFFVAIHFLFFIPANDYNNWKPQVFLVAFLSLNAVLGLTLDLEDIHIVFVVDGLIKIIYGTYMIYITTKHSC